MVSKHDIVGGMEHEGMEDRFRCVFPRVHTRESNDMCWRLLKWLR